MIDGSIRTILPYKSVQVDNGTLMERLKEALNIWNLYENITLSSRIIFVYLCFESVGY